MTPLLKILPVKPFKIIGFHRLLGLTLLGEDPYAHARLRVVYQSASLKDDARPAEFLFQLGLESAFVQLLRYFIWQLHLKNYRFSNILYLALASQYTEGLQGGVAQFILVWNLQGRLGAGFWDCGV